MKTITLLIVLSTVALAFSEVIQLPVEQHVNHKNGLAKKWREMRMQREWPGKLGKFEVNEFGTDYLTVNMSVGTPLKEFTLLLSSGSSRAWIFDVFSFDFPRKGYNPKDSVSSKNLNKKFEQFGFGFEASGDWYSDKAKFQGAIINEQAFGVISKLTTNSTNPTFPSPLGFFGFNHFSKNAYRSGEFASPIDNILKDKSNKTVTLWLDKFSPKSPSKGQLTIGGFDNTHCNPYTGQIIPLTNLADNRLVFTVNKFTYGDINVNLPGNGFIDTSLSTLIVPTDALYQVVRDLSPNYNYEHGVYVYPCKNRLTLKPITIALKDAQFDLTFTGEDYLVDIGLLNEQCALALDYDTYYDLGKNSYIFGTPLARSRCLSWDFQKDTIGVYLFADH